MSDDNSRNGYINRILQNHPIFTVISIAIASFSIGFGSYHTMLEVANLDKVQKNTYILKEELVGDKVLRKEVVNEIERLIDRGENLNNNDETKSIIWLLEVLAFIHSVPLEKDFTWQTDPIKGQKMSAVEADIRWAQSDSKIDLQVLKTIGILKGLRSALRTRTS